MEWMYKANDKGVNPDDYLLGKQIDSAVLEAQREDDEKHRQSASGVMTVDISNKIREDPLFAIKQMEANKRKTLLQNPIRLKQLQEMLQSQVGTKTRVSGKRKEKTQKKKKRKRSHRYSSNDLDDSDDLDDQLMAKLKSRSLKGKKTNVEEILKRPGYGLIGDKAKDKVNRFREKEKVERKDDKRQSGRKTQDDDSDPIQSNRNRDGGTKTHRDSRRSRRSRSRSPIREKMQRARKMDDTELDIRRREMMDNAKWREKQRKTRVDKYKAADDREDEMERKKSKRADFFNPLTIASHSSVEDRIKRNIHNIQRTKVDQEKNFAKR